VSTVTQRLLGALSQENVASALPNKVVEVMEFATADATMRGEMTVTFSPSEREGANVLAVHDNVPAGVSESPAPVVQPPGASRRSET
jgi:hypothetical protein